MKKFSTRLKYIEKYTWKKMPITEHSNMNFIQINIQIRSVHHKTNSKHSISTP